MRWPNFSPVPLFVEEYPRAGYQLPWRVRAEQGDVATVGLVAGWGRFPVLVAEALVRSGQRVVCVALRGLADPALEYLCEDLVWSGVGQLGGHIRFFKKRQVVGVTLAGKLFKAELLFRGSLLLAHRPDWTCLRTFGPYFLSRKRDTRDDTLLTAVTSAYQRQGIEICPATDFAPELLVSEGLHTRRKLTPSQARDVEFGWEIAKQMGGLDIGQSITVRDGTVLAVEAVEGTDACIERTGQVCRRGGWTLVKLAKPEQDMRFDVPTIGPQTVEKVYQAGGRVIAIEASRTIVVDAEKTYALADKLGLAIVALPCATVASAYVSSSSETRAA